MNKFNSVTLPEASASAYSAISALLFYYITSFVFCQVLFLNITVLIVQLSMIVDSYPQKIVLSDILQIIICLKNNASDYMSEACFLLSDIMDSGLVESVLLFS